MTFSSLDTAFYDTANLAGGGWLKYVTMWSTVISWGIANALVAQAAVSRILLRWRTRQAAAAAAGESAPAAENALRQHPVCGADFAGFRLGSTAISITQRLVKLRRADGFLVLHIAVINHYIIRQKSRNLVYTCCSRCGAVHYRLCYL